jgi:hypothetical protein
MAAVRLLEKPVADDVDNALALVKRRSKLVYPSS